MSAQRLREAATLMRKRAEAANREQGDEFEGWYAHLTGDGRAWVAARDGKWLSVHGHPNSAEHIASWHPAVALAVADWLEAEAEAHVHIPGSDRPKPIYDQPVMASSPAMRLANAYLGADQ